MWNTNQLKERGREVLKLNYWKCVIVSFILTLVASGTTSVTFNQSRNSEESQQVMQEMTDAYNGLTPGQQFALLAGISGVLTLAVVLSIVVRIFVYNPMKVGGYAFFKKNVLDPPADLNEISVGFRNYLHIFITLFLNDLFISLWSILLIVPGIVKS